MYYVIQRHHGDPKKHYMVYSVPRYISSEKSKNLIFEFKHNNEIRRKWAPKEEIILITDDKELFKTTLEKLEALKDFHLKKIDVAEQQLNDEINSMIESMKSEFDTIQQDSLSRK